MAQPAQRTIRRNFPRPSAEEIAPFRKAPTGMEQVVKAGATYPA